MKMETSHLLVCLLICFLLHQTYVAALVLKSVHPHASVRMQFGAEHSPAPFSTNPQEIAKIDGETQIGIEVPTSADHRNILLHKVGTYLAVVMKALAKTVEPPQTLDGSSTHLDFHVDAEFKEPQAHVSITEKHPAEIILQTLWKGGPQYSENPCLQASDVTNLSSRPNGAIFGITNSEHLENTQGARPTSDEILSILNGSPLISSVGISSQTNYNFDSIANNIETSGNNPSDSNKGLSIKLSPLSAPTSSSNYEEPLNILNNLPEPVTGEKLFQNKEPEKYCSQLNDVSSHQENNQQQDISLPTNSSPIDLATDPIFGLIAPTLGGLFPPSGNILLLNISLPLSKISPMLSNEMSHFPGQIHDFGIPLKNYNFHSLTNIPGVNTHELEDPFPSILRNAVAKQISDPGNINSDLISTAPSAYDSASSLLGGQVNSDLPSNLDGIQSERINYPRSNNLEALLDNNIPDENLTFSNSVNNVPNNYNDDLILDDQTSNSNLAFNKNVHPAEISEMDNPVSNIWREAPRNQFPETVSTRSEPNKITSNAVNTLLLVPDVIDSSIGGQTNYSLPLNSNLIGENYRLDYQNLETSLGNENTDDGKNDYSSLSAVPNGASYASNIMKPKLEEKLYENEKSWPSLSHPVIPESLKEVEPGVDFFPFNKKFSTITPANNEIIHPDFISDNSNNGVISKVPTSESSSIPSETPFEHIQTPTLNYDTIENNVISDVQLHTPSTHSSEPGKPAIKDNVKTLNYYPSNGPSRVEIMKSSMLLDYRVPADGIAHVSHGGYKYPQSVITASKHRSNEHNVYHASDPYGKYSNFKYNVYDKDRRFGEIPENVKKSLPVNEQDTSLDIINDGIAFVNTEPLQNEIFDKARNLPVEDIEPLSSNNETYTTDLSGLENNNLPFLHNSTMSNLLENKSINNSEENSLNNILKNIANSDMNTLQTNSPLQEGKENDEFFGGLETIVSNITNISLNISRNLNGIPTSFTKDTINHIAGSENHTLFYDDFNPEENPKNPSPILHISSSSTSQNITDGIVSDGIVSNDMKLEQLSPSGNRSYSNYAKELYNLQSNSSDVTFSNAKTTKNNETNTAVTNNINSTDKITFPIATTEKNFEIFIPYQSNLNERNRMYSNNLSTPVQNITAISNGISLTEDFKNDANFSVFDSLRINGSNYDNVTSLTESAEISNDQITVSPQDAIRNNGYSTPVPHITAILETISKTDVYPQTISNSNQISHDNIREQPNMIPGYDYTVVPLDDLYFRGARKNVENLGDTVNSNPDSTYVLISNSQDISTPPYPVKYIHKDITSNPLYDEKEQELMHQSHALQIFPEHKIQTNQQPLTYVDSKTSDPNQIIRNLNQNNIQNPRNQLQLINDIQKNVNEHILLSNPSTTPYPETTILTFDQLQKRPDLKGTHTKLEKESQIIRYNNPPTQNFQQLHQPHDSALSFKSPDTIQDDDVFLPELAETRINSVYDLDNTLRKNEVDDLKSINYAEPLIPYSNKESDSYTGTEETIPLNYQPEIQLDDGFFVSSKDEVKNSIQPSMTDILTKKRLEAGFMVPENDGVDVHEILVDTEHDSKHYVSEFPPNLNPIEFYSHSLPDFHIETNPQSDGFGDKLQHKTFHDPISSDDHPNKQSLQIVEVNPNIQHDYINIIPEETITTYEYPKIYKENQVNNIDLSSPEKLNQPNNGIQSQSLFHAVNEGNSLNLYKYESHPFSAEPMTSHKDMKSEDQNERLKASVYTDELIVPKYFEIEPSSSPFSSVDSKYEPYDRNGVTEVLHQLDAQKVTSTHEITNSHYFEGPKFSTQEYELILPLTNYYSDQHPSSNHHEIKHYLKTHQSEDLHSAPIHGLKIPESYHSSNEVTLSPIMKSDETLEISAYESNALKDNYPSNGNPNALFHTSSDIPSPSTDSVSKIYGFNKPIAIYPTEEQTIYQNDEKIIPEKSHPLFEGKDTITFGHESKTHVISSPASSVHLLDSTNLEKSYAFDDKYALNLHENEISSKPYLNEETRFIQLHEENSPSEILRDNPTTYYDLKPLTNQHLLMNHKISEIDRNISDDLPINPVYNKPGSVVSLNKNTASQIYEDKLSEKPYHVNDINFPLERNKLPEVLENADPKTLPHLHKNKAPEQIFNSNSLLNEKQPERVLLDEEPVAIIDKNMYPDKNDIPHGPSNSVIYYETSSPKSNVRETNVHENVSQNKYNLDTSPASAFLETQTSSTSIQGNPFPKFQQTKTSETSSIDDVTDFHEMKLPKKLQYSDDVSNNERKSPFPGEYLNPSLLESKFAPDSNNNLKSTFEDDKQNITQDDNYRLTFSPNKVGNKAHSQHSVRPININNFEADSNQWSLQEVNNVPSSYNKDSFPESSPSLDNSGSQINLQSSYQNYPISSYYVVESLPISGKDSQGQYQLGNKVSPINNNVVSPHLLSRLNENSDPNIHEIKIVNAESTQPEQLMVQGPNAVAPFPYYAGEDGTKPRIICLTEQRDNIEILRSLKDDISKLKQKLNCD